MGGIGCEVRENKRASRGAHALTVEAVLRKILSTKTGIKKALTLYSQT